MVLSCDALKDLLHYLNDYDSLSAGVFVAETTPAIPGEYELWSGRVVREWQGGRVLKCGRVLREVAGWEG